MRVTINDDEEVDVGDGTAENYWFEDPDAVNDAAFKCSICQTVTVHEGYEFKIFSAAPALESVDPKTKRVYLCTNCAKVSVR